MTTIFRVTVIAALLLPMAVMATPANAGYPIKCSDQTVLVVRSGSAAPDGTFEYDEFASIQAGIDAAQGYGATDGDDNGSGVGDTVIVCKGTYFENVHVPGPDDNGTPDDPSDDIDLNANISIRSWSGPDDVTIVGDLSTADAVVDIDANGVNFGGAGLGFTITAISSDADGVGPVVAGIQVGDPLAPDMSTDDDADVNVFLDCYRLGGRVFECPDEELPALTPINVTVAGNEINGLVPAGFNNVVSGIAVNNSNNTLVFRNLVDDLAVEGDGIAYGIRFADTNSNVEVLQNAVKDLSQTGSDCGDSSLDAPSAGAVAMSAQDEALDALFFNNLIKDIEATCTAVGIYSDAWGGLENDRNGQQIPIVTDVVNNKVHDVVGAESAAVVLAVADVEERTYGDDDATEVSPPSSFRVSTNDLDGSDIGVAVFSQLSMYTYIEQNNFDDVRLGVQNNSTSNLDATNNWWGCSEGPYSSKKSCASVFPKTGPGTPDVAPWLKHHVDHAGSHAGDHAGHH